MESCFIYNAVYQVVLSANSSLKSCIKSMQMNLSRNRSESFNLLYLQDCAFFTNFENIKYLVLIKCLLNI